MKKVKLKKRKILCPDCKTGMESYKVDPTSEVCPYFSCYNGFRCSYYVPVSKRESNFFLKLIGKVKNTLKKK